MSFGPLCACGCGDHIVSRPEHSYAPARYLPGHHLPALHASLRKNDGPCRIKGCARPAYVRRLCSTHYHRERRQRTKKECQDCGVPINRSSVRCRSCATAGVRAATYRPDIAAAFEQNIERRDDGCWIWTGLKNRDGYGRFWFKGKSRMAHRYAWEDRYGRILAGLVLHHECENPSCVNLGHLKCMTRAEHVRVHAGG